ncbi:unnamed protein product, partial [Polarella glacialis]
PSTPADHAAESGSFLFLESRPGEEKSGEEVLCSPSSSWQRPCSQDDDGWLTNLVA